MKFTSTIFSIISVVGLVACSTGPSVKPNSPEAQPDKVLSRIDDMSARPSWLKESEPFKIENGVVTSLGSTVIPGDHRVEAAYRIAENNAKAAFASSIEQRLEFVFQNAEEGTSMDTTQARFIGAEASKITTSAIHVDKRYWEKVVSTKDSGERVTSYRVFVVTAMPEAAFKKAVEAAAAKAQGKGTLSADFAKKVDENWDKIAGTTPASAPAQ